MHKQINALGKRATSIFLAAVLATGLIPAGALAFADDAAEETIESTASTTAEDSVEGEAADPIQSEANDENTGEADAETSTNATSSSVASENRINESVNITESSSNPSDTAAPADQSASETSSKPAGDNKPVYTYNGQDRISIDVPTTAEKPIMLGDVEYKGLTYRINADGETATLIGLGSTNADTSLAIPSQISTGESLLSVTAISAKGRMSNEALAGLDPYTTEFYSLEEKTDNVENITIPASITDIDVAFFQLFPSLKNIYVSEGNKAYSDFEGILFSADTSNLLLVPEGLGVTLLGLAQTCWDLQIPCSE